jgi:hypothetical protein
MTRGEEVDELAVVVDEEVPMIVVVGQPPVLVIVGSLALDDGGADMPAYSVEYTVTITTFSVWGMHDDAVSVQKQCQHLMTKHPNE